MDSERCPLHVQSNVSGVIAQEAGRPKTIAQLFREHCPSVPAPASASVAPAQVHALSVEASACAAAGVHSPLAAAENSVAAAQNSASACAQPAAAAANVAAASEDAVAPAAALLSSLSLIDPAAEAIPYD
jgi:hypothetical protein